MNKKLMEYYDTLTISNRTLDELVDTDKIILNVKPLIPSLQKLNSIITTSQKEIESKIEYLFENDKSVFQSLPILIAVRDKEMKLGSPNSCEIQELLKTVSGVKEFIRESGLMTLILNGLIKDFIDYLVGVEIGLDSNSRKNRGGSKVENYLLVQLNTIFYSRPEIVIETQKFIDGLLPGDERKRFDIVITNTKTNKKILVESSFYNSGGSKISETARSFNLLHQYFTDKDDYQFIWLADGAGMLTIKQYLLKIFDEGYIMNNNQFLSIIKDII